MAVKHYKIEKIFPRAPLTAEVRLLVTSTKFVHADIHKEIWLAHNGNADVDSDQFSVTAESEKHACKKTGKDIEILK